MMPSTSAESEQSELYCWPWFGIVANTGNVPGYINGVDNFDYWLRKFSEFQPSGIEIFRDVSKCTGQVVVRFNGDWTGFKNAMKFEKSFVDRGRSREKWILQIKSPGTRIYGWIAREDDYRSEGPLGDYLTRHGSLKTITSLIRETSVVRDNALCCLADFINLRNENLDRLRTNYKEKKMTGVAMIQEHDKIYQAFDEVTKNLQLIAQEHIKGVSEEREMLNLELQNLRQRLDKHEEALIERERRLEERDSGNNMLIEERRKAEENLRKLVQVQQREKESLERVLELERKLDEKHKVEKENVELKGKLVTMMSKAKDVAAVAQRMQDQKNKLLQEKSSLQNLVIQERQINDELQEARKELIKREKEARERVLELERKLDETQKVEKENVELKGKLEKMTRTANDGAASAHRMQDQVNELLQDKNFIQNLYQDLVIQERRTTEGLQDSHKELIKREKEALELERKLGEKQKVEMENVELKSVLETVKRTADDGAAVAQRMQDQVNELLQEKNYLQDFYQDVVTQERRTTDELQEARKELIKGFTKMHSGHRAKIGIKRVGNIDTKAFKNTCSRIFKPDEVEAKALELCSLWQEKVKNPEWYPFRIVEGDEGNTQRMLKEDDEALQGLKAEWGEEIHNAVVEALKDLNEYNPSGCYAVAELWNFVEDRKASLKEVISYVFTQLKTHKRRRA